MSDWEDTINDDSDSSDEDDESSVSTHSSMPWLSTDDESDSGYYQFGPASFGPENGFERSGNIYNPNYIETSRIFPCHHLTRALILILILIWFHVD
eukprot:129303_1